MLHDAENNGEAMWHVNGNSHRTPQPSNFEPMCHQFLTLLLTLVLGATAQAQALFPRGFLAPNRHHTGNTWLQSLSRADSTFDYNLTVATSAPGSFLNWHRHPAGQQLLVLEGEGYYQERGAPVLVMRRGDVIKCAPGVEHWHGSTPTSLVSYLAVYGGPPTEWLEPVPDSVYHGIAATNPTGFTEQLLLELSRQKWQWMADKNVDALDELFHERALFVRPDGTRTRADELETLRSAGFRYEPSETPETSVVLMGETAVLLAPVTLRMGVDRPVETTSFVVTEIYLRQADGAWRLGSLTFTERTE